MGETVEDSNTDTVSMSIDSSGQSNSSNLPHAPTAVSNATTAAPHKPALPNETLTSTTMSSINVDQSGVNKNSISTKNLTSAPGTSDNTTTSITNTRSRRDRPCDACRRRKSRCVLNEGSSICVLCRFHNQDCTFVQSPQPRKRRLAAEPTGGDNKTDRDRNRDKGDRESRHKGKDADGGGGRDIERGSGSKKRSQHDIPPLTSSRATIPRPQRSSAPPLPPTSATRGSRVEDNEPPLNSLGLEKHRYSYLAGSTAQYEPSLIELCPLDSNNEFPIKNRLYPDGTTYRVVTDDYNIAFIMSEEIDQEIKDLDEVEAIVSPHGQALINLYFRVVHPSYPILHKKLFLEKYQRSHREFAPCLLAAVYIISLTWWKHDPELSKLPPPDLEKLEKVASRCMSDVISRPKLSTIQAGLLLLQRLGPAASSKSWALTAQLVAVGQELGLHLDCVEWRIPQWEKGLRKRLAWALFMQDKWGALTHGRPSHITSSNWAVRQISPEDFPEGSRSDDEDEEAFEIEKGKVLFMEMIKLTQITGEILDGFFTVDANRTLDGKINRVLERAKPMQIKLKEWYARLPDVLRMDSAPKPRKLSSNGYLHLAYFATEITLHRQILRTLSPPPTSPQPIVIPDAYLLHICRSAAKTRLISAMDFVNRLKPEHLQSFWFFASKVNFALIGTFGSLLWATSPTVQEAEFYKARLAEYRWTLSVSAKGADFMEFAVGVLDIGLGRAAQQRYEERHPPNGNGRNNSNGGSDSGLGMIGFGGVDGGMSSSGMSSMSTGSGISSPSALPPPPQHMSPPVTGDEMDQDDEDDDEDDDDPTYDTTRPGHAGFRIAHGSDHDVDMEFMGDSRYGYGNDEDEESDGYSPHPPQALSPYSGQQRGTGTSHYHQQPQPSYHQYEQRNGQGQSYQYPATSQDQGSGGVTSTTSLSGGKNGISQQ